MKEQFEIWLVNLNPSIGTEPGKIRPSVVIQTNLLNQLDHPATLICPITSQLSEEENILRVKVEWKGTGLEQESEILVDQIRALDNRRFIEKLGKINKEKALELQRRLKAVMDLIWKPLFPNLSTLKRLTLLQNMRKIKPYHFSLHSYLSLSDNHYVEGRYLWISNAFSGASNLLWLSFEQIIKLLIVQSKINNNLIKEVTIKILNGPKRKVIFDSDEKDVKVRFKVLDSLFFEIEPKHRLEILLKILDELTGIRINRFEKILIKLNEGFKRRYVVNEGFSYNPLNLDQIDEAYFFLRSFVSPDIPQSFVDEIIFRNRFKIQEPIPFFETLFLNNNHIQSRQYLDIIDKIPDGKVIAHNGIKFKEFPIGSYEYLVKKGYLIHTRFTYLKMKS